MKIYLLNPPFIKGFCRGVRGVGEAARGGTRYYPIGLSYATGLLEEAHNVRLLDAQAREWEIKEVLEDVLSFNPDIIIVDSNFSSLNNDISVANELKKKTGALCIMVGPPTSQYPDNILSSGIDIVARYEYEFTLKDIVDNIEINKGFESVKGISYNNKGVVVHNSERELASSEELDSLPFVSKVYKEHLRIQDYFLSSSFYPVVQLFTGRGCPNKCTFCSWPVTYSGRKYRPRSIKNVLDEFEYISKELPEVEEIFIEDDTFTVNQQRVLNFCDEYIKRNLSIPWSCNSRATLDIETMKKMKKANCRLLICGFESGSDNILKNIKKGVNVEKIKLFTKNAKNAGLLVHGDIIIGLPGESMETIKETKKLIKETRPHILQVLIPQPIPGTELYDWCKSNNYLLTEDPTTYIDENGFQKSVISYPNLSNDDIICQAGEILKNYYMTPKYIPLFFDQIMRANSLKELKRLFYSSMMFLQFVW